jgi:diadenosine tetraphosphate (Ap4A) HIT family hydrolase
MKSSTTHQDCFICRKHADWEAQPPGGYLYEDAHWKVGHGPSQMVGLGTLVIESARHYLDFAEMTTDEATSYGPLLARLYVALKAETGAERIYTAVFMEGASHFHAWLHPRLPGEQVRGPALLMLDYNVPCDEAAATRLVVALRARLAD